ncbi:MAG: NYN domain-containing protein [Chloroflexi bacterium]|nr:NYN domain-containing protein [Chloroflexota bacterium]
MPYLIDGHNLVPFIAGLSLADLDDEMALIQILQRYASQQHKKIEVYFDQASAAKSGSRSFGIIKVHFIRQDSTADKAIMSRLARMGNEAKNWTVVSSDREILAEARSFHSQILKSSDFAKMLKGGVSDSDAREGKPDIPAGDIDYWLDQFSR